MTKHTPLAFPPGEAIEIDLRQFTVGLEFHAGRRLTVTVLEGDNAGFTDTVEYEAVAVRNDVVALSWQERIGSTIVHVVDFANGETLTFVTPAKGGFLRLPGKITSRSSRRDP
jgi:hypothetical protein